MKHLWIGLVLLAACGNDDQAKREAAMNEAARREEAVTQPAPAVVARPPSASAAKPAPPPEPEPTTPAEIDHARNQAMIDGRDKDVLHYCELGKLDAKSNPQALLGCTLAACRIKDEDTARRYAKPLAKAYMDQAKRVCSASQISL